MVWIEAMLVGLVVPVVGPGVGVGLGWVAAISAPPDLVASVVVPWASIVAVGVVSVVLADGVAGRRSSGLAVPPAEAGRSV